MPLITKMKMEKMNSLLLMLMIKTNSQLMSNSQIYLNRTYKSMIQKKTIKHLNCYYKINKKISLKNKVNMYSSRIIEILMRMRSMNRMQFMLMIRQMAIKNLKRYLNSLQKINQIIMNIWKNQ